MRHDPDAVMLFAAGFGTRMRHLTKSQPKPLVKVGGRALIDHTLDLARAIAPGRVVANLHYLPEQLEDHLAETEVTTTVEAPEILETGGGLRAALPLLGEGPVFTANTDAIWKGPNPFELLKQAWRPEEMDALLLCVPRHATVGHKGKGDFVIDKTGRLSRGPGHVYGGIQIMKTEKLHGVAETAFSLNILWNQMFAEGRLFGLSYPGKWCDVGSPEGIDLAEALLEQNDV
ncbi:nucleotidyltransferase family protein [Shimia sp. CNT1-13L.2]|uniref:nucleotidyltransferase family protein n=1 Tax=Shimia sp. CNT1-13L.2 TaxID=2959663 RepID=UPI0020CEDBB8|nr:nucleotidyltransferase family protein [Shimia sp. CNT1-13L.2]MCP9482632.1 nucleotidyltransferase family protein [Shimia sp. CNT1-13L.2]